MASPERFYQQENKGSFVRKLAGYTLVGVIGIGVVIWAFQLGGASGIGIPTTPNAPFLQAA